MKLRGFGTGDEGEGERTAVRFLESVDRPAGTGRSYLLIFEKQTSFMVELPAAGEVVIGRAVEADVRLHDQAVSRRHARITIADGQATLEDLGSQNGTKVAGSKIPGPHRLAPGEVITVCSSNLVFHSGPSTSSATRAILPPEALLGRAEEELERALRFERPLTLVAIDLAASMGGLERGARAFAAAMRKIDVLGWSAGGQLLVLMPETARDHASEVISRLVSGKEGQGKARAGLAAYPSDGADVPTLLATASMGATTAQPGHVATAGMSFRAFEVGRSKVILADPAMHRVYALVERLAGSDLPVLVNGETGSGKELVAQALHAWSPRRKARLVTLNCAAVQESLVESELFGHEKGAFSGAIAQKQGLLEAASGGTVFLDEIGELPLPIQAKLLRALETKRITRLGSVDEREVDIRVVTATHRDLPAEVTAGRFRSDLLFRLEGARVRVPPLRERPNELPLLAEAFLREACGKAGRKTMTLSDAVIASLRAHSWPGNVRELKNVMEFAAATVHASTLEPMHLPSRVEPGRPADREDPGDPTQPLPVVSPAAGGAEGVFRPIEDEIRDLERSRMAAALKATSGNRTHAAALISMPLRTFLVKIKQYGLGQVGTDHAKG